MVWVKQAGQLKLLGHVEREKIRSAVWRGKTHRTIHIQCTHSETAKKRVFALFGQTANCCFIYQHFICNVIPIKINNESNEYLTFIAKLNDIGKFINPSIIKMFLNL